MDVIHLFTGGFPGTIETFEFLQDAYAKPLNALAAVCGEKVIIDGVTASGGNYTAGYITFNKEIFPFVQSPVGSTVRIYKEIQQVAYNEDLDNDDEQDLKDAYEKRYATTGVLSEDQGLIAEFPFSDLARISNLRNNRTVGEIMFWPYPGAIPAGWVVADGNGGVGGILSNGLAVRDLRNHFIKGAGSEQTVNTVAGGRTKTIAIANLPSHNHSIAAHSHFVANNSFANGNPAANTTNAIASKGANIDGDNFDYTLADSGTPTANVGKTSASPATNTGNQGSGTPLNVEPLHYAAVVLQWNGL